MHAFVALVLSATMVHLNFVRVDAACARHATQATRRATEHVTQTHAHGGAPHGPRAPHSARSAGSALATGAAADPERNATCETPAQADCCAAMLSCSPAFTGLAEHAASVQLAHAGISVAAVRTPRSAVASPDPPPPRA